MAFFRSETADCMSVLGSQMVWKVKEDSDYYIVKEISRVCFCAELKKRFFVDKSNLNYVLIETQRNLIRLFLASSACVGTFAFLISVANSGSGGSRTKPNTDLPGALFGIACFWLLAELAIIYKNMKCGKRQVVFFAGERVYTVMKQGQAKALAAHLKKKGMQSSGGRVFAVVGGGPPGPSLTTTGSVDAGAAAAAGKTEALGYNPAYYDNGTATLPMTNMANQAGSHASLTVPAGYDHGEAGSRVSISMPGPDYDGGETAPNYYQ